jgi:hypothetical protein
MSRQWQVNVLGFVFWFGFTWAVGPVIGFIALALVFLVVLVNEHTPRDGAEVPNSTRAYLGAEDYTPLIPPTPPVPTEEELVALFHSPPVEKPDLTWLGGGAGSKGSEK